MKIAELGKGRQEGVPRGVTRCQWYMSSTPEINETTRATPGSTAISQRQAEALEIVRAHRRRTGLAPTRALLREAMKLRKNSSVERHLNALSRRGWLEVMPNVERGLVPLREGVPLYDEQQLQRVHMVQRQHGARPPEPTWLDCPALWTHLTETPDLCLRMGDGAVEGSAVIVALARRRDAAGNATVADGAQLAVRIGEIIVVARARVLDKNAVQLRWESGAGGETGSIRMDEESDAAEIVGCVIGRVLPGAG